jgi:DNA-binding transcriptional LysR family regulator
MDTRNVTAPVALAAFLALGCAGPAQAPAASARTDSPTTPSLTPPTENAMQTNTDRKAVRGTSMTAVVNAAKAGVGVAIVPCFMADASLERVASRVLATSEAFLVTTDDSRSIARVRIVADALANLFAKERRRS